MIVWTEQEPDFKPRSVDSLLARLDFSVAASIWSQPMGHLLILIDRQAREVVECHLRTQRFEQGGLLLGNAYGRVADEPTIVTVEEAVPANDALGTGVSLTMGAQVWEDARARSKNGQVVIGWYHSHPNLGAFFSGTDRRTQRAFFGNNHSVGLVSDPVRGEEMWFSGADSFEVPPERRLVLTLNH